MTATVESSSSGGTGVISSPGDYSMVFSGTATYYVAWTEGDEERIDGPFTVPLTPSEGGRLTMPFRLVAVEKLTCGDTVSRTSSPGTAETLGVPVGYNNGSVTVTATPTPSGEWPEYCPSWSGDILSCNSDTATVDTSTPGLKTVTASCGNSISLKVQVIGVGGLQARRKGSDQAFGGTAVIAAFIDLQGISPNDGEYSVTWRHRFSDENNAVVLDRMLAALSPNWIFKGKDIDIWKANTVTATCVLDMSCNTPQGPALGTLLNNSLTLSFE